MIWLEFLVRGWEHENVWPMLALPFFDVLKRFNNPELRGYLSQYKRLIEKHHNFIELFTEKGEPFKTAFYTADEGMIWSAVLLDLMS